jgi:dipeptide/tripeptide permease
MSENKTFLGHPRGLATLFMTEFFERFTYYGMRALLVLFLVAATTDANPGLGIDRETAGAIYGLYTGAVFLFSLPGGWIADRLIGQRRAVYWGGIIIALGNFLLAVPGTPAVSWCHSWSRVLTSPPPDPYSTVSIPASVVALRSSPGWPTARSSKPSPSKSPAANAPP